MVEFWQYTNYTGTWAKLIGPGCTSGSRQWQWFDTQQNGWGLSSWKSYDSCWAVTLYYGQNYGRTQVPVCAGHLRGGPDRVALEQPRLVGLAGYSR